MCTIVRLALVPVLAHWTGLSIQTAQQGQLTIVVRDSAGTPLAGVLIALYHDHDDGRVDVGERRTDGAGRIVYGDLAWGLYIVQFRGMLPDGQRILPAARQNLGLLDDGSGVGNGFGVRLASSVRTELFVLATVAGEADAVPMFDLAAAPDQPPQPIDPLLLRETPEPTNSHSPTVQSTAPNGARATAGNEVRREDPTPALTRPVEQRTLALFVSLILLGSLLTLLGWCRARRVTRKDRT